MGTFSSSTSEIKNIDKLYRERLDEVQTKFFKHDQMKHIFRVDGFRHDSWKYNLKEDLRNSSNSINSWKNEVLSILEKLDSMEIDSQSKIFYLLFQYNFGQFSFFNFRSK